MRKIFLLVLSLFLVSSFEDFSVKAKEQKDVVLTEVTNPAVPGCLSVVAGAGWNLENPNIRLVRLDNTVLNKDRKLYDFSDVEFQNSFQAEVVQNDTFSLVCKLPQDKFTVYAVSAQGKKGWSRPYLVNSALIQWVSKKVASESDTLRLFGRNLVNLDLYKNNSSPSVNKSYGNYLRELVSTVVVEDSNGKNYTCEVIKNSAYDVHFVLPRSLSTGKYKVYAHNGLGGDYGWSSPVDLEVVKIQKRPTKIFNVKDYGALGHYLKMTEDVQAIWQNEAPAIQKALDAAGQNGGGIVYVPAGDYYLESTLVIPKNVTLRGESRERCWFWFPDCIDHGEWGNHEQGMSVQVGIRGVSDFTIENLNLHSVYTNVLVAAPLLTDSIKDYNQLDNVQRANNVEINNCSIVHEPYYRYAHRKKDPYLDSNMHDESRGMKAAVALSGDNITITNSRIRGGGMGIALLACRYANVSNNELIIGESANALCTLQKGFPKYHPEKVIVENNKVRTESPKNHSGFWFHATSSEYYVANNNLQMTWGCDAEGILWHGWAPEQAYYVKNSTPDCITVESDKEIQAVGWECMITKGRGLGQPRVITRIEGNKIYLNKPLDLLPEKGGKISLIYFHSNKNHIVVGNKLRDTGAGIFAWGTSYNWIVDGNEMTRAGGVMFDVCSFSDGRMWAGNYFHQILNNVLNEGRYYTHQITRANWTIGYTGIGYNRKFLDGSVADLGHIYRGNVFNGDAALSFWERDFSHPDKSIGYFHDIGIVAEDNYFNNCKIGIGIKGNISIVVCNNKFNNVTEKITYNKYPKIKLLTK